MMSDSFRKLIAVILATFTLSYMSTVVEGADPHTKILKVSISDDLPRIIDSAGPLYNTTHKVDHEQGSRRSRETFRLNH